MAKLKNPPLPKNQKWLVVVALAIFVLAVLVAVLLDETIEKPKKQSEVQDQIKELEVQIAQKQENEKRQALNDAEEANNFDPDVSLSSGDSGGGNAKFSAQEGHLKEGTTEEYQYLKERVWGFWHIILPLFIVVGIFLYWVWKKHRKWAR